MMEVIMARKKAVAGREQELSEVDREIIGALTEFRDTLRARTPLESKYTARQVVVVVELDGNRSRTFLVVQADAGGEAAAQALLQRGVYGIPGRGWEGCFT